MGGKNENTRFAPPESVPIHLHISAIHLQKLNPVKRVEIELCINKGQYLKPLSNILPFRVTQFGSPGAFLENASFWKNRIRVRQFRVGDMNIPYFTYNCMVRQC